MSYNIAHPSIYLLHRSSLSLSLLFTRCLALSLLSAPSSRPFSRPLLSLSSLFSPLPLLLHRPLYQRVNVPLPRCSNIGNGLQDPADTEEEDKYKLTDVELHTGDTPDKRVDSWPL